MVSSSVSQSLKVRSTVSQNVSHPATIGQSDSLVDLVYEAASQSVGKLVSKQLFSSQSASKLVSSSVSLPAQPSVMISKSLSQSFTHQVCQQYVGNKRFSTQSSSHELDSQSIE